MSGFKVTLEKGKFVGGITAKLNRFTYSGCDETDWINYPALVLPTANNGVQLVCTQKQGDDNVSKADIAKGKATLTIGADCFDSDVIVKEHNIQVKPLGDYAAHAALAD